MLRYTGQTPRTETHAVWCQDFSHCHAWPTPSRRKRAFVRGAVLQDQVPVFIVRSTQSFAWGVSVASNSAILPFCNYATWQNCGICNSAGTCTPTTWKLQCTRVESGLLTALASAAARSALRCRDATCGAQNKSCAGCLKPVAALPPYCQAYKTSFAPHKRFLVASTSSAASLASVGARGQVHTS